MSEFLAADLEEEKTIQSNTVRGCFSKKLWWEVCELSNLLLAETVGTVVFSMDPAHSLVCTGMHLYYCRCLSET